MSTTYTCSFQSPSLSEYDLTPVSCSRAATVEVQCFDDHGGYVERLCEEHGPSITYDEACDHAAAMHAATEGLIVGGTYRVRFPSGRVAEVELRVSPTTGTVRSVA